MKKRHPSFLCMVLFCAMPTLIYAGTINVPADQSTVQAGLDAASSGDTVLVAPGTYTEHITWPSVNGIVLTSSGSYSDTELNGGGSGRIIIFPTGDVIDTTTVISDLTLRNGSSDHGGAVYAESASPKFVDVLFTDNVTTGTGGACYMYFSSSVFVRVAFTNNSSFGSGGGVVSLSSTLVFRDAVFTSNSSNYGGGFRAVNTSNVTFLKLEMSQNESGTYGGALDVENSTVAIDSASFHDNSTDGNGGGLALTSSSSGTVTNASFSDNSCAYSAGGVYCKESTLVMSNSTIESNISAMTGGGLYFYRNCDITLTDVLVEANTASHGGGMFLYEDYPAVFTNVVFSGNVASTNGGGIYSYDNSATFTDATVSNNSAGNNGGGFYLSGGSDLNLSETVIQNNTAAYGGGLFFDNSGSTLEDLEIVRNVAEEGGAVYIYNGAVPSFMNVSFLENEATSQGAAWIVAGSTPRFELCLFANNSAPADAYTFYSMSGAEPSIVYSNISNPGNKGFYNDDVAVTVDADTCWWGDSTGPYHPIDNTGGLGDSVSQFVDVTPWLTSPNPDAPPAPPENLVLLDSSNTWLQIAWDESLVQVNYYFVYYGTDSTSYTSIDTVDTELDAVYMIMDLEPGTKYYIGVTVEDIFGKESWYSNQISAHTTSHAEPEPFSLLAPDDAFVFDDENNFPLTFSWEISADADEGDTVRYTLQLSTDEQFTTPTNFDADTFRTYEMATLDIANYWWRVVATDLFGISTYSSDTRTLNVTLSAPESGWTGLPSVYSIAALYPNPFNPTLSIVIGLPEAGNLRVSIYNTMGQRVEEIIQGYEPQGYHQLSFDGSKISSGIYFVHANVPGKLNQVKKVVLMK